MAGSYFPATYWDPVTQFKRTADAGSVQRNTADLGTSIRTTMAVGDGVVKGPGLTYVFPFSLGGLGTELGTEGAPAATGIATPLTRRPTVAVLTNKITPRLG